MDEKCCEIYNSEKSIRNSREEIDYKNIMSKEECIEIIYEFNDIDGYYKKDKCINRLMERYYEDSFETIEMVDNMLIANKDKIDCKAFFNMDKLVDNEQKEIILPRNEVEKKLLTIWSDLLNINSICVKKDFFDIGGDSLEGVILINKIEETFGIEFKLSDFINNSTIESLANVVNNKGKGLLRKSNSIAIQPKGNKSKLFVVHPVGGSVLCYNDLSKELGREQPIYGLEALDYNEFTNIEELAIEYIKSMKEIQKNPPYFIAGWSSGGVIAFEMARQLVEVGENVRKLILIDSILPKKMYIKDDNEILSEFARNIAILHNKEIVITSEDFVNIKDEDKLEYFMLTMKKANLFDKNYDKEFLINFFNLYKSNLLMTNDYRPKEYLGSVLLIRAKDFKFGAIEYEDFKDEFLGWCSYLKGQVEIESSCGNHWNMVYQPHIKELAKIIKRSID